MRVLWVVHNLAYPPVRGVLQRNYNLLRQAAKGAEVHVLAFDQPASRPAGVAVEDCVTALKKYCSHVECVPLMTGATKSKYWLGVQGLLTKEAYDLSWFSSRAMAERIRHEVARFGFDAIHFDTIGLAPYRRLAGRVGTVLNHHNIESSMMSLRASNENRAVPRWYWQREARLLCAAERQYASEFSMNFVVSTEDGEVLEQIQPSARTRVIANGVDTEFFSPRLDPGGNTLLFCGGLDWYPNGDAMAYFFEQIWPKLRGEAPNVQIVVVGRKPPVWLSQLAETDLRVTVTGFVDDVRPYFRDAAAYFCPIRVGGGTRLKILDALAMGMPLISTSFACSGIDVKHESSAILADTPDDFVAQTLRVLSDADLRARLAANGRELVCDRYSWDVVGNHLRDAYREAAEMSRTTDEQGSRRSSHG